MKLLPFLLAIAFTVYVCYAPYVSRNVDYDDDMHAIQKRANDRVKAAKEEAKATVKAAKAQEKAEKIGKETERNAALLKKARELEAVAKWGAGKKLSRDNLYAIETHDDEAAQIIVSNDLKEFMFAKTGKVFKDWIRTLKQKLHLTSKCEVPSGPVPKYTLGWYNKNKFRAVAVDNNILTEHFYTANETIKKLTMERKDHIQRIAELEKEEKRLNDVIDKLTAKIDEQNKWNDEQIIRLSQANQALLSEKKKRREEKEQHEKLAGELKTKIEKLEKEKSDLIEEVKNLNEKVKELTHSLEVVTVARDTLQNEVFDLRRLRDKLMENAEVNKDKIADLREQLRDKMEANRALDIERTRLQEQLSAQGKHVEGLLTQIGDLKVDVSTEQGKKDKADEEIKEKQNTITTLKEEIASLKAFQTESDKSISDLQNRLGKTIEEKAAAEKVKQVELSNAQKDLAVANEKNQNMSQDLGRLRADLETAKTSLARVEGEKKYVDANVTRMEGEVKELKDSVKGEKDRKDKLQAELGSIKEQLKDVTADKTGLEKQRETTLKTISDLEKEIIKLENNLNNAEAQNKLKKAELVEQHKQKELLQVKLENAFLDHKKFQEKIGSLEAKSTDLIHQIADTKQRHAEETAKLNAQIKELTDEKKELTKNLVELRVSNSAISARAKALEDTEQMLKSNIDKMEAANKDTAHKQELENLKKQTSLESLQKQLADNAVSIERLQNEIKTAEKEIGNQKELKGKSEGELAAEKRNLEEVRRQRNDIQKANDRIQKQLDDKESKLLEAEATNEQLESMLDGLHKTIAKMESGQENAKELFEAQAQHFTAQLGLKDENFANLQRAWATAQQDAKKDASTMKDLEVQIATLTGIHRLELEKETSYYKLKMEELKQKCKDEVAAVKEKQVAGAVKLREAINKILKNPRYWCDLPEVGWFSALWSAATGQKVEPAQMVQALSGLLNKYVNGILSDQNQDEAAPGGQSRLAHMSEPFMTFLEVSVLPNSNTSDITVNVSRAANNGSRARG